MSNVKDVAKNILEEMPNNATWEDIMYEFYVRMKIGKGLEDIDQEKTFTHSEVEKRFGINEDNVE